MAERKKWSSQLVPTQNIIERAKRFSGIPIIYFKICIRPCVLFYFSRAKYHRPHNKPIIIIISTSNRGEWARFLQLLLLMSIFICLALPADWIGGIHLLNMHMHVECLSYGVIGLASGRCGQCSCCCCCGSEYLDCVQVHKLASTRRLQRTNRWSNSRVDVKSGSISPACGFVAIIFHSSQRRRRRSVDLVEGEFYHSTSNYIPLNDATRRRW